MDINIKNKAHIFMKHKFRHYCDYFILMKSVHPGGFLSQKVVYIGKIIKKQRVLMNTPQNINKSSHYPIKNPEFLIKFVVLILKQAVVTETFLSLLKIIKNLQQISSIYGYGNMRMKKKR